MLYFSKDKLTVKIFADKDEMGIVSANEISQKIQELLLTKDEINMVFAAAPSQNEMLNRLVSNPDIEWNRINAFHMDEYIGLGDDTNKSFGTYLKNRLFDRVNFKAVNCINGETENPEEECERYAEMISKSPIDIVCLGIGENGHLAFNDPHVADFNDAKVMKVVELDYECRKQQVNDGCFVMVEDVPEYAMSLTIPTLLSASYLYCVVPGKTKAQAVQKTIESDIDESCPSTILRNKKDVILYIDRDSGSLLEIENKFSSCSSL